MPAPLNLLKAFEKGIPLNIIMHGIPEVLSPADGKAWLVLSGIITHITAADTIFFVCSKMQVGIILPENATDLLFTEVGATATGTYNLFGTQPESDTIKRPTQGFHVVTSSEMLYLTGDPGAAARLKILEWTP